ncbi:MAG: ABC transporter permease [Candidatus Cloacimonetes bacterium]|nr:ABC transporter permease [Candidatus Cloacimonadota bacterium]
MQILIIYIKKFFLSKRLEWLKFDSIFMYLGIIISVAALVTTFIIFEGYETTIKNVILGVNSHVYIFRPGITDLSERDYNRLSEFLLEQPEVNVFNGVLMGQAIASRGERAKGAIYKSVDWKNPVQASIYHDAVVEGTFELIEENDVVIGIYLARLIGANIGDEIQIMSTSATTSGISGMSYNTKQMKIVGLFNSGMYEYDSRYVFLNVDTAREFDTNNSLYTMIEVQLHVDYINLAREISSDWEREWLFEYQITSWIHFNGNFFSMLALQKWVLTIVISFLIVVASFNVITTTFASIQEKRKEIGLLKTIGLSGNRITLIFLSQINLISSVCIFLGILTGIAFGYLLSYQTLISLRGEVYFLDRIYIYVDFLKMVMIYFIAFVIINLSSIIPLKQISKLREIEILRYRK